MATVLVTGGSGFVGSALLEALHRGGHSPIAGLRKESTSTLPMRILGDLSEKRDNVALLEGCEVVIHTAAYVHQMGPLTEAVQENHFRINRDATVELARQCSMAGVRRFVFVSSVKVNGEETPIDKPFSINDQPTPQDPYGKSKWQAEEALLSLSRKTGMDVTIVRPPLVYGPGVKANFESLVQLSLSGLPLPFGAIRNLRSFVSVTNLVDLLVCCVAHPAAAGRRFFVSDGDDLSTGDLVRRIAAAHRKRLMLVPIPATLMEIGASLLGRGQMVRRLTRSLRVDKTETRDILGWQPPVSCEWELQRIATSPID